MTHLAYFLIAVIPLTAVATIVLAGRPGRAQPLRGVPTEELKARLDGIDSGAPALAGASRRDVARDRARLKAELLRRGHGREPGARA